MMKQKFWKQFIRHIFIACALLVGVLWAVSCEDEYTYDEKEPDWLGASIYDYLKDNGNFTYYTKLIEDLNYTDVLRKTGSKTLFVANDSSFNRFFQNNPWGISSYNELSMAQKKLILNYAMINNAYLIETFSNYNSGNDLVLGKAMRRATAISIFDTIPFEQPENLPLGKYWNPYRTKGIHILKDHTSWPMVYFLQKQLRTAEITPEDFEIVTGDIREANDAHIFNNKVIRRDIACKNGYINVLEDVLIPPSNMADIIDKNPQTSTFSSFLDRYCAPYYSKELNDEYKKLHPSFEDTVFVKKYYTIFNGGGANIYPYINTVPVNIKETILLPFDPGWNSYRYISAVSSTALQADMATMFVPTNEALEYYFNQGKGKLLKDRYGAWENIPDDVLVLLLRRHMRKSFIESVPSRFPKMQDDENFPVPVKKSDVVGTAIGVNGLVYFTNNVYPPADYESVYAPVLFSERTKIMNWAIVQNDFRLYLNSLESRYSFFVPTDAYLDKWIDPFTYGKDNTGVLKYIYNEKNNTVTANVYLYDKVTKTIGDSVNTIVNSSFIVNRLLDILDSHVVVGNVESGQKYYFTKGGNIIKVDGAGMGLTVEGGGDIELGQKSNVIDLYPQGNGNTYFIDKPIQTSFRSVFNVLSTTPQFSNFFNLLNGFPATSKSVVFVKKKNYFGIDFSIKFFNTFNYTVYVPTNEAIQDAITKGMIIPWESQPGITGINDMTDPLQQNEAILKLERFLRYHFQDNSVFISGNAVKGVYTSATIKTNDAISQFSFYGKTYETLKNKYFKIGVFGDGSDLSLTTTFGSAKVDKQNGLYNIITRDYIFNGDPGTFKEIVGGVTGLEYSTSAIYTSSTAVIHQVDKVLLFE